MELAGAGRPFSIDDINRTCQLMAQLVKLRATRALRLLESVLLERFLDNARHMMKMTTMTLMMMINRPPRPYSYIIFAAPPTELCCNIPRLVISVSRSRRPDSLAALANLHQVLVDKKQFRSPLDSYAAAVCQARCRLQMEFSRVARHRFVSIDQVHRALIAGASISN